jgi:hypothetical protein
MTYSPTYPGGWEDFPNTSTPITAAALNTIESGITSVTDEVDGAWVAYTPTLGNMSIGDGTIEASYKKIASLVVVKAIITLGSTSSITGIVTFSHPVTSVSTDIGTPLGNAVMVDGSIVYPAFVVVNNATASVQFRVFGASSTYATTSAASRVNATVPFTWASGDIMRFQYAYEAA